MANLWEYRTTRHRVSEDAPTNAATAELAAAALAPMFTGEECESLVVAIMDRKQRIHGVERVYRGTVSGTPVRLAEVFRFAVRQNATGIMIAHNHPSGDPTPSADDIRTTRDAAQAGRTLGIEVVDHLVFGDGRWVSLRRIGAFS